MKVYVIAWNYAYEGYGEPQKAFATLEAAEESIKGKEHQDPTPEIFELEVQGMPEEEALPYAVVQATSDYVISRHRYVHDALESARNSSEVRRVIKAGDLEEDRNKIMNDIKIIETALITGTEKDAKKALKALDRVKNRLPAPTAGDRFREFYIGQEFTTENPDTYVFVKVGETSAVRFARMTHATTYYADVFAEGAFPSWDNASLGLKLITVEEVGA